MPNPAEHFQTLLGKGLWADDDGLVATAGRQFPGVRITAQRRTGPDTVRVEYRSGLVGVAEVYTRVNGSDWPVRTGRAVHLTQQPGYLLQFTILDQPAVWPALQFPDFFELVWERVEGATHYEIRQDGVLLTIVPEVGQQYYIFTTPPLADGAVYEFSVRAIQQDYGIDGSDVDVAMRMVTLPVGDPITFSMAGLLVTVA